MTRTPRSRPFTWALTRSARIQGLLAAPTTPGILLIACTVLALVAANTGIADAYHAFFHQEISIGIGAHELSRSLGHWVNEGLMAVFFFVIGLEIKRELLIGHLSSLRRSALPVLAALGGMVVPGVIYAALNAGGESTRGWAIPTATDIAFAVGVLTLLGNRIPPALKVFLLALAIVDDLGAVLVIALFYTDTIAFVPLAVAGVGVLFAVLMNAGRVRVPGLYAVVGLIVWLGMLKSGVHATIAGVLMGFAIPARTLYDGPQWLEMMERALGRYRLALGRHFPDTHEELGTRQQSVHEIEVITEKAQSPLIRLEHSLNPWVTFLVIPAFVFANAGVAVSGASLGAAFADPITWGVFLGLFLGKQIGVFGFSWLAVRLKIAEWPPGTTGKQFYGTAILAGIGFTMSLFVTELSFAGDFLRTDMAKIGTLSASFLSGIVGYVWLRIATRTSGTAS